MKKTLICGAASLVMAATPVLGAFAADVSITGGSTKDVTVGEIDETIYSVDIDWGDLSFDWKYNPLIGKYAFFGNLACTTSGDDDADLSYLLYSDNLYTDHMCSQLADVESALDLNPGATYYSKLPQAHTILITDNSVNGSVSAQASFTPSENYTWVNGVFSHVSMSYPVYKYSTGEFENYTATDGTLESTMGWVPAQNEPRGTDLHTLFHLEVDDDAKYDADSVTAGDKIGTITLNITPDLN